MEDGLTRRTIFARVKVKAAVRQSEGFIFLAANKRQNTNERIVNTPILNIIVVSSTIEEAASLSVVAMQVAEQFDVVAQPYDLQHLNRVENRWVNHPIRAVPLSIQVASKLAAAVISKHHTVRIEHRNDPNDEVLTQGKRLFGCELLQQTAQNVTGLSLTGVHATGDHNRLLVDVVDRWGEQPFAKAFERLVDLAKLLTVLLEEFWNLRLDDLKNHFLVLTTQSLALLNQLEYWPLQLTQPFLDEARRLLVQPQLLDITHVAVDVFRHSQHWDGQLSETER